MNTLFAGKNFIELGVLGSTNEFAENLLSSAPPEGTVVWAHHQTSGRGQAGTTWHSEAGKALTFSIILYPRFLTPSSAFMLNKMASLAIWDALQPHLPENSDLKVKWPNDLRLNGKKICGILFRNQLSGSAILRTILGIGLNVNQESFPPEIAASATSLRRETGRETDLRAILESILQQLERHYLSLRQGNSGGLDRRYLQHLYLYQEQARFRMEGREVEGYIVGVEKDGRLAIQCENRLLRLNLKEVEFLT